MTIKQAIEKASIELKINQIDSPKQKARILMQYILKKDRQYIIVYDEKELEKNQQEKYFEAVKKVSKGIPLQHITNMQEFMKMNFYVDENVLIPRPDTEVLVEEVIKIARKTNSKKILDLCTGSGAIAVSLAKYLEDVEITAIDISSNAVEIAKKNAIENKVESKIKFIESNMFEKLSLEKFDIIVSNPPYIKSDIIKSLERDVRQEPYIALDGGIDGLDFYRKILKEGSNYLKYKGYICLEIGYDQKIDVIELIENEEKYKEAICIKDLYGNDRVIITRLDR
jgi:release factor glutamine methyltransferase